MDEFGKIQVANLNKISVDKEFKKLVKLTNRVGIKTGLQTYAIYLAISKAQGSFSERIDFVFETLELNK